MPIRRRVPTSRVLTGMLLALALTGSAHAQNPRAQATELMRQGMALEHDGKLAEAEDAYRKAQEAYAKAYGPTNPRVGAMLEAIVRVYIEEHRDAEAEPILKQGLAIMEDRMGHDSVEVVAPLTRLGTS